MEYAPYIPMILACLYIVVSPFLVYERMLLIGKNRYFVLSYFIKYAYALCYVLLQSYWLHNQIQVVNIVSLVHWSALETIPFLVFNVDLIRGGTCYYGR